MQKRKILILSPQSWGNIFTSKHNYAIEFAAQGNEVYFLNPPSDFYWNFSSKLEVKNCEYKNLNIVSHKLFFPYILKFKAVEIFHYLIKFHLKKILKRLGDIDLIISFELGNLYPLKFFQNIDVKVFFPVDEPLNSQAILAAQGATHIMTITKEILDKYSACKVPKLLLNHGVAECFFNAVLKVKLSVNLRIGLSGNFFRTDIDRITLLKILKANYSCQFEFFGAYSTDQSNVDGRLDRDTLIFLDELAKQPNAVMHGPLIPIELSKMLQQMDAFLICYDINKDQSKGTNYHKIMEYLATGKVIISNNVTAYQNKRLIEMPESRCDNGELPNLFSTVIANLDYYNSEVKMQERIKFAKSNLYSEIINSQILPFVNFQNQYS